MSKPKTPARRQPPGARPTWIEADMPKVAPPTSDPCCWRGCRREVRCPWDDNTPPLCTEHLIRAAAYAASMMGALVLDDSADYAAKMAAMRAAARDPRTSVVYYVRMGDHVKIGTTIDIDARMSAFYLDHKRDALLATEPGGYALEHQRHREFAAERVYRNRELFNPSRRLLAHIEALSQAAA